MHTRAQLKGRPVRVFVCSEPASLFDGSGQSSAGCRVALASIPRASSSAVQIAPNGSAERSTVIVTYDASEIRRHSASLDTGSSEISLLYVPAASRDDRLDAEIHLIDFVVGQDARIDRDKDHIHVSIEH